MSDEEHKPEEPIVSLGRDLRREDFTPERIRRIADAAAAGGRLPLMSEEARRASLKAIRESVPAGADAWVFGYGSLMWNPAINVAQSAKAHVRGYHRMFCLTLQVGRATPEQPGLMLGIDRGGSCTGVAHRIAADAVESELSILWMREMLSGAYEPRWVNADIEGHGRTRTLTFVINRYHPRYEGTILEDAAARRIASAQGHLGTNRDYLYRTVKHLADLGVDDGPMHSLEAKVRHFANEPITTGA
ncbi:MAG TPA: gamma-glutamylcyclotransferase [Rhizomicrobium sp.]|jgi:cation transport protein ChaC|nr:gamma-glutamylcyclotransferase [Rhizomicrobium sp.]